jgi:hypothetical protein
MPRKLWEHPNPKETGMWKFMEAVNGKKGLNLQVSVLWVSFLSMIVMLFSSSLSCVVPFEIGIHISDLCKNSPRLSGSSLPFCMISHL